MPDDNLRRIAEDLSKHAAEELQLVLNRHAKVAQGVLPPAEMMGALMRIANGVQLGAILYALQSSKDHVNPDELFTLIANGFVGLLESGRETVLAQFAAVGRAEARG